MATWKYPAKVYSSSDWAGISVTTKGFHSNERLTIFYDTFWFLLLAGNEKGDDDGGLTKMMQGYIAEIENLR